MIPRPLAIDKRALGARPLREQIEHVLRHEMTACWFPTIVDPGGGFLENLDRRWRPTGDTRRSLVYQARVAWSAAAYATFDDDNRDAFTGYAEHGIAFIDRVLRDDRHGGFFYDVDRDGRRLRNGEKHAVAIAFAVMAAAKTHAVTGSSRSLRVADDGFDWLEAHGRTPDGAAYVEEFHRDGTPMHVDDPRRLNPLGLPYERKTSNVHIHLMEAFTELLRARERPSVRAALARTLALVRDRFVTTDGALLEVLGDRGPSVRDEHFGHAIETAHLLLAAQEVLGDRHDGKDERRTTTVAVRLADRVLARASDRRFGGTFNHRVTDGHAKVWWVQAEALCALAYLHRHQQGRSERYRRALGDQWRFILDRAIDGRYGGWFERTSRRGFRRRPQAKAHAWKACYHTTRALLEASRSLHACP